MGAGALAVLAGFTAFGGLVAALAGAYGLRQTRRLTRAGVRAQALVKISPGRAAGEPAPPRPLLQFATEDGRVMEIVCPVPSTRRHPLRDGDQVSVAYDPADPRTAVVHGRERLALERAFLTAGTAIVALALGLLAVALLVR
ncbi:hypothetical protein GCM10010211_40210 [Streptomyces albospinus]|uniref:DUF3592 domain-containing protein n=1 Tax=Streptomyces albospinus TaxID=285515 RepID=A0ABQ2V817_9ACTN|nr:DUF3592 domain-containing protein [Streptomyces albospinus]GGU70499.1 hypothetical protein GCM10010211_40210 [Streptomyces albospinus]